LITIDGYSQKPSTLINGKYGNSLFSHYLTALQRTHLTSHLSYWINIRLYTARIHRKSTVVFLNGLISIITETVVNPAAQINQYLNAWIRQVDT
jgi:hypothetical protein